MNNVRQLKSFNWTEDLCSVEFAGDVSNNEKLADLGDDDLKYLIDISEDLNCVVNKNRELRVIHFVSKYFSKNVIEYFLRKPNIDMFARGKNKEIFSDFFDFNTKLKKTL